MSSTDYEREMHLRWAVNGAGRVGRIERITQRRRQQVFEGVGIDGQPWDSMAPQVLAPSNQEALDLWKTL